jgi:AcrR family transcriptional regulator
MFMPSKTAQPPKPAKPARSLSAAPAESLRSGLKQFTRQRMLDAALQCFRERGYQDTTVEKIVELAGTTVPTFYRHFPSKSDLLYPLLDHLTEEVEATLRALDGLDVRNRKEVRRWLDTYMVMWGRVHKLCAAHWEATNLDETYAQRVMDDGLSCASVMENVLGGMDARAQDRFKIRLGLMIMYLDRMAMVVTVERSAARAQQILDEMANMLWLILNNDPVLDA